MGAPTEGMAPGVSAETQQLMGPPTISSVTVATGPLSVIIAGDIKGLDDLATKVRAGTDVEIRKVVSESLGEYSD